MRFKFSEEQLSIILSMHVAGKLSQGGQEDFGLMFPWESEGVGCLTQIAFNNPTTLVPKEMDGEVGGAIQSWFDGNYNPNWTPERFLQELEKQGWA